MKKILFTLLALLLLSMPVMAQAVKKGYYRVQNNKTQRYIFLVDYKTKGVLIAETSYDVDALRTRADFANVVSDPSTVYYIENVGGTNYNLKGQGKDVYDFVGRYLTARMVKDSNGNTHFTASGIYHGIEVFLYDSELDKDNPDIGGYLMTGGYAEYMLWNILPVSANDDTNYFGIQPAVTIDNQCYAPFYASFPFTPAVSGMKVYTVSKVDGNMAVISEVQGTIAGGTPVIIACPGATPSDNRINIEMQDADKPANNKLSGEYFNSSDFCSEKAYHYNALPWDAATMRVLGKTKSGKLGFIRNDTMKTIPRNKAFLKVSADAPDEIVLLTPAEYEEEKAKVTVTLTAADATMVYGDPLPSFTYTVSGGNVEGTPAMTCEATSASPVGTYDIVISEGTVTYPYLNLKKGTLTITEAPLTATAGSYQRNQGEPNPDFAITYEGFKNGENESVLEVKPVASCEATDTSAPGMYKITVSGGQAKNYAFTYVDGVLEVVETQGIAAVTASFDKPSDIFTVDGRCVRRAATTTAGLPSGLYIVAGRKVVIR